MSEIHPLAFYALAAMALLPAYTVVTGKNLFHSGLALILCFLGIAGLYVTLHAPFLAAMQVLVYAGAIAVILLFAFMLTHDLMHSQAKPFQALVSAPAAAIMGAMLMVAAIATPWHERPESAPVPLTLNVLAKGYLSEFFVAFQLIALLLLATLIGAVVIARKEEGARGVDP